MVAGSLVNVLTVGAGVRADVAAINAAWSPDGKRIAFASGRDGNDNIYVMNADGAGLTRLTNNPASEFVPAWGGLPQPVYGTFAPVLLK